MIIQLTGPIEGVAGNNIEAFRTVASDLRALGHEVINPHELCVFPALHQDHHREVYMRACLEALVTRAQVLCVLPRYQFSPGGFAELYVARQIGLPVMYAPRAAELQGFDWTIRVVEAEPDDRDRAAPGPGPAVSHDKELLDLGRNVRWESSIRDGL